MLKTSPSVKGFSNQFCNASLEGDTPATQDFHISALSYKLSSCQSTATVLAGSRLDRPTDSRAVSTAVILILMKFTFWVHVMHMRLLLVPWARKPPENLLSLFFPILYYRIPIASRTSHCYHYLLVNRSNDNYLLSRDFSWFFLSSNE